MNKSGCITWLIFCLCIYLLVYQTKIFLIILGCISIIILILLLFSNYSEKKDKKKKLSEDLNSKKDFNITFEYEKKQIHKKELEHKITLEEVEQKLKKEEEKKRLEQLNEIVIVVYETTNENGKPVAIVKRSNNTYTSVERPDQRFEISEKIKIEKQKTNKWNWYDEEKYQERLEIIKKTEQAKKLHELNSYKPNWEEFREILLKNNITKLYHFTDKSNIPSIKLFGGLYSWYYCENNDIEIPKPGGIGFGRDLDKQYNLQNFVRLCLTKKHPMLYAAIKDNRINDPVILEIDIEVAYLKETRFSNMNATKTGHSQGKKIEDLEKIRFDLVGLPDHFNIPEEERHFYQAEILILEKVPLKYISNINSI